MKKRGQTSKHLKETGGHEINLPAGTNVVIVPYGKGMTFYTSVSQNGKELSGLTVPYAVRFRSNK